MADLNYVTLACRYGTRVAELLGATIEIPLWPKAPVTSACK